MKAYKGFDKNMKCGGFQFAEGETYHTDAEEPWNCGFLACEMPVGVFEHYAPCDNGIYREVDLDEVCEERIGPIGNVCARTIKVGAELGIRGIVSAQIEWIKNKISFDNMVRTENKPGGNHAIRARSAASATSECSAASVTGNYSVAVAGDSGVAAATGDCSAASADDFGVAAATGWYGVASVAGDSGIAAATGDCSAASATDFRSAASATSECSAASVMGGFGVASVTGNYSVAVAGDSGVAAATGDYCTAVAVNYGIAAATGDYCAASATGDCSAGLASGLNSCVMGALGCAIFAIERDAETYKILSVGAAIVDGIHIKPNVRYALKDGKFVEVE